MKTKVCSSCKIEKNFSCFSKDNGRKSGLSSACKECRKKICERYRNKNIEILRKKGREKDPKKRKVQSKKYYKFNKEKVLLIAKNHKKKSREELKDSYVKRTLTETGFPNKAITNEIIEIQRLIIQAKRLLKNKNKKE